MTDSTESQTQIKSLSVLLRTNNNKKNEKISTSMKCSDIMDHMVPENPENAIFCNQEESKCLMMESMVLKKKFDDVFESTEGLQQGEEEVHGQGQEAAGVRCAPLGRQPVPRRMEQQ
jgi:hypothetical protein